MNVCQTQTLPMMQVPKMTVELKNEHKAVKAKRTTRVIATPLAQKAKTKKDLDDAVRMGILENVSAKNNHDLFFMFEAIPWKNYNLLSQQELVPLKCSILNNKQQCLLNF